MLLLKVILTAFLALGISGKTIKVQMKQNVTSACPNVPSNIVNQRSIKLKFNEIPSSMKSSDELQMISQDGKLTTLKFPSCYRVQMSFELLKPLKDPYIELFMQMGSAPLPCQEEERENVVVHNFCTNITTVNWCPKSENTKLRQMTKGRDVCRFCNLCAQTQKAGKENNDMSKYFVPEGRTSSCSTDNRQQNIQFKVCTPDKNAMNKVRNEEEEKLERYWGYLKQGVFTIVVHVSDRSQPLLQKLKSCKRMCDTYENDEMSITYKNTLEKTIKNMCAPKDIYSACLLHTMKFDVMESF